MEQKKLVKIAEVILIIRETRTEVGDAMADILQAYFNLKKTGDERQLVTLASECERGAEEIRLHLPALTVIDGKAFVRPDILGGEHEPGNPRIPGWERLQETETYFEYVNTANRNITLTATLTKEGWEIYLFDSENNKTAHLITAPESRKRLFDRGDAKKMIMNYMQAHPTILGVTGTKEVISRIEGWEKGVPHGDSRRIVRQEPELIPIELPRVTLAGKTWFFDERLKQIRNVENPHEYRDLTDQEVEKIKKQITARPTGEIENWIKTSEEEKRILWKNTKTINTIQVELATDDKWYIFLNNRVLDKKDSRQEAVDFAENWMKQHPTPSY